MDTIKPSLLWSLRYLWHGVRICPPLWRCWWFWSRNEQPDGIHPADAAEENWDALTG